VRGWDKTELVRNADFAAGLFAARGQQRNPALVLGPSGLIGIDVDSEQGRLRLLGYGPLPKTVVVTTGNGWHLWFRPPRETRLTKIEVTAQHVKLTHGAGYFICPPAIHTSGATYRFVEGHDPWSTPIAVFPADLLERLEAEQHRDDEFARHDDASFLHEGERHAHLLRLAGAMRCAGGGEPEIAAALLTLNARRCRPPKDEYLVRELARDVVGRYAPGDRP
jgi:putative DNA primase/helicase